MPPRRRKPAPPTHSRKPKAITTSDGWTHITRGPPALDVIAPPSESSPNVLHTSQVSSSTTPHSHRSGQAAQHLAPKKRNGEPPKKNQRACRAGPNPPAEGVTLETLLKEWKVWEARWRKLDASREFREIMEGILSDDEARAERVGNGEVTIDQSAEAEEAQEGRAEDAGGVVEELLPSSKIHEEAAQQDTVKPSATAPPPRRKITRVLCLALGSISSLYRQSHAFFQLAAVMEWIELLGLRKPDHLVAASAGSLADPPRRRPEDPAAANNSTAWTGQGDLFVQDPVFNALDRQFLECIGWTVVPTPRIQALVTQKTMVYIPHGSYTFIKDILDVAYPAVYVGNDLRWQGVWGLGSQGLGGEKRENGSVEGKGGKMGDWFDGVVEGFMRGRLVRKVEAARTGKGKGGEEFFGVGVHVRRAHGEEQEQEEEEETVEERSRRPSVGSKRADRERRLAREEEERERKRCEAGSYEG